jgi:hypothetical protein
MASVKELALTREQVLEDLELRLPESVFYWRSDLKRQKVKAGSKAGCLRRDGYTVISVNGDSFLAHRLIWFITYGEFPDNFIDHVDGGRSNNRIENLRDVTRTVNNQNMLKYTRRDADLPTGVKAHRNKYDEIRGYRATWNDMNGKEFVFYFGIREWHTLAAALAAAIAKRELQITKLQLLGAAYTERHGK